MPWRIGKHAKCPKSKPHAVIKTADGSLSGCHKSEAGAKRQLAALNISESKDWVGAEEPHMNSKDRRKKRRAEERRQKALEEKQSLTADEIIALTDPEPVEEEKGLAPIIEEAIAEGEKAAEEKDEKMVIEVEPYAPFGGAQSWGELDEYLEAQDMEQAVRQSTWEFGRMTNNVLNDLEKDLPEKSELIVALANELPMRVEDIREGKEGEIEETVEPSFIDRLQQLLKADAIKTVGNQKLRARDFAHVPDIQNPATWKMPLVKRSGVPDESRITAAITSLQPAGLRGQRTILSVPKSRVVGRIRSAISKLKAPDEVKKRLRKRLAAIKAIEYSGFQVFKDQEGMFRWFGWVTNKWRDRDKGAAPDHGGEILTEASHKEFVAWVDKNPSKRMPELWAWHTKGSAVSGRADWIDYADGFVLMSGPLSEEEAESIGRVVKDFELGMSHGFYALTKDKSEGLITQYRTFEVSHLPLEDTANPWTDFMTVIKEVEDMGLSDKKRGYLTKLAGEEFVQEVEDDTEGKAALLDEAGVDFKEEEAVAAEEEAPAEEAVEAEPAEEVEAVPEEEAEAEAPPEESEEETEEKDTASYEDVAEVIKVIGASIGEVKGTVAKLAEQVEALSSDDEKKITEKAELTPRASLTALARSAIGQDETRVDGRTSLAKEKPEEADPTPDVTGTGISILDNIKQRNIDHGKKAK